jgi:heat shock protein HtpX
VPGPRLTRKGQPRLFAAIEEVARACKQSVPSEVYLIPQVNAWVSQRGGVLGLFSRRVLGIGLPLMQVVTVSQLRAILAHEFGHYDAGDTLLGPLIYQTRSAIGRTIGAASGSFLDVPFELYGEMYLSLTQSISRQQELNADRLACRVAGSRAVVGVLRTISAASPAYIKYWNAEMAPILEAGFLPPIAEGFGRYFAAALADPQFVEGIEIEMEREQPERFDSHPPDRERIAAAQMFPPGDSPADDPSAITLLDDPQQWERRMLRELADAKSADNLQPVTWDEVVTKVYLPGWEAAIRKHATVLGSIGIETIPVPAQNLLGLAEKLKLSLLYRDSATRQAAEVLAIGLACALVRQGWAPQSVPGKPFACRRGAAILEPLSIVQRLASGELSRDGWRQECAALGIANASLAPSPG